MKKLLCSTAAVLALGGGIVPAAALACHGGGRGVGGRDDHEGYGAKDPKVTLCHATGSASNPYVKITVSAHAALRLLNRPGERIPPFTFRGATYGDPAAQAFVDAGCTAPAPPPPTPGF